MSITLNIQQIIDLAEFAGLKINEELSVHHNEPEALETELTIEQKSPVRMEDGTIYTGSSVYFTEYPEEGSLPLEKLTSSNTQPAESAEAAS